MTPPLHARKTDECNGTLDLALPSGPRRTFFIWMIRVIPSLMGLGLLIPLLGYVSGPAFRRRTDVWSPIGKAADLPPGEPQELEYAQTVKDGWRTTSAKKAVLSASARLRPPSDCISLIDCGEVPF